MARSEADRARTRLRAWLALFALALALPGGLLVYKAYDQLKWESFRRQQLLAQDLAAGADRLLADLVRAEEARPPEDYGFLVDLSTPGRRSPLADYPAGVRFPGLMGWFAVGQDGRFETPWVPAPGVSPAAFGVGPEDLAQRQAGARRIEGVLVGNQLVEPGPVAEGSAAAIADAPGLAGASEPDLAPSSRMPPTAAEARKSEPASPEAAQPAPIPERETRLSQAAFERLAIPEVQKRADASPQRSLGRVEELALGSDLAERGPVREQVREEARRYEQSVPAAGAPPPRSKGARPEGATPWDRDAVGQVLADEDTETNAGKAVVAPVPVRLFDGMREPFRLGRLDSGHLVLFRRAQRAGEQVIQGLLIEQGPFLAGVLGEPFAASLLAGSADLTVAHRGELLTTLRARPADGDPYSSRGYAVRASELTGELLHRSRLPDPFGALELIFSVRRLPDPPGASAIGAIGLALGLVLIGGTWFLWRLGARQIALASQQQAFVSAVSHELKTPLTSIRMYAEMLRAGYAEEGRRDTYYRYIHEESERLSRLIANVLTLSRIGRGQLKVKMRPVAIAELMGLVVERVSDPIERAGFRLDVRCAASGRVLADPDAVVQVLINLVDNALKFAAGSDPKVIELACEPLNPVWWRLSVRDFGPGVPRASRRRVFGLFYRGPEAVKEAVPGTGIGLAMVEGLTRAMGGRVAIVGAEPGAEVRVELRAADPQGAVGA